MVMENMRCQATIEMPALRLPVAERPAPSSPAPSAPLAPAAPDWRICLPTLSDERVTLRQLRPSDAPALYSMLSTEEVTRFVTPPPPDVRGFERFIQWALAEQAAGRFACFAVVPAGLDQPIGITQIRQLDPTFAAAEWGICFGSAFWGTGLFMPAARLLLEFAFATVGVHRLEARAAVQNGRANGSIRKLGAVQEGVLRRSLMCDGRYLDQILWSILAEDWREARTGFSPRVH
jgi:RimJ/RimL family protein N-acetyltransferase